MPNIFIDFLEAAEADADPNEPLAPPHAAGCDGGLPHCQGPAAVQQHLDGPLHVHSQHLFQRVVVLVLPDTVKTSVSTQAGTKCDTQKQNFLMQLWSTYQPGVTNGDNEIKERFQSCMVTRGISLNLEIAFRNMVRQEKS